MYDLILEVDFVKLDNKGNPCHMLWTFCIFKHSFLWISNLLLLKAFKLSLIKFLLYVTQLQGSKSKVRCFKKIQSDGQTNPSILHLITLPDKSLSDWQSKTKLKKAFYLQTYKYFLAKEEGGQAWEKLTFHFLFIYEFWWKPYKILKGMNDSL